MQQQPHGKARPALFAQHLEIGGVIGARLLRHLGRFDARHPAHIHRRAGGIGEAVAEKGIEPAAKRLAADIIEGPAPHRHAGRGGFVRLMAADRRHAFRIIGREEGDRHDQRRHPRPGIEEAVAQIAQRQHAEHGDADQPSAGMRAHRHQQRGEDQRGGEQRHRPAGPEDRAMARDPPDQRHHRNGHGGQGAALIEAGIFLHQGRQLAIAAARQHRLDPGRHHDGADRQHDEQRRRLQPEPGAEGERQEDRKDQRLPHPGPFRDRRFREIGHQRGRPAIEQQRQHQAHPGREAAALLAVEQQPAAETGGEGEQRQRQGRRQRPADLLRGDDIDIEIGQHPDEGPLEAERDQPPEKQEQRKIKHRRRHLRADLPAGRDRDRRARSAAARQAPAAHGTGRSRNNRSSEDVRPLRARRIACKPAVSASG